MPKFQFEIRERKLMQVEAPSASELFFNYEKYEENAELIDVESFPEPEHIREVTR